MIEIISFLGSWQIQVIVSLIAIDVLLGIISALVKKEFQWGKLANFMKAPVLGYVFGFAVLEVVSEAMSLSYIGSIVWAAFILILIALLASIFRNLNRLGIPVPDSLKK